MISKQAKKARVTAIVIGALLFVALTAFVFAFIQQGLANLNAQLVKEYSQKAEECETRSNAIQTHAQILRIDLQRKNDSLEQELVKLINSRTE